MKDIYIVLTKSKTFISKLIDFALPSEYTHSSIAFDSNLDEMYSVGRKFAFLLIPAHLKIEYLDKGFYHYYDSTKIGIYSTSVSDESYEAMKDYVNKLYQHNRKLRYSFIGLIYCGLNKSLVRKNRMFCSQFVCNVLKHANEDLIDKVPELCTPNDFLNTKGLNCHYIGKISELVELKKQNNIA